MTDAMTPERLASIRANYAGWRNTGWGYHAITELLAERDRLAAENEALLTRIENLRNEHGCTYASSPAQQGKTCLELNASPAWRCFGCRAIAADDAAAKVQP